MYGKQQSTPDKATVKAQKRQQLIELLVNKFRNKYNINGSSESDIDYLIRTEVTNLLEDGNTYEGNLYKLDKKLESMVKQSRSGGISGGVSNKSSLRQSQPNSRSQNRPGPVDIDAQSQRSARSAARSIRSIASSQRYQGGQIVSQMPNSPGRRVVHTDLAADLNPTEKQWNEIVQQNLKNFEEEKVRVKEDKFMRTKKIQEEQKLQMAKKADKNKKDVLDQLSHFNKIGVTASDKFYLNEDARKKREASMKGNSKQIGETMHGNYQEALELNRLRMKKEAEERIQINVKLAEEDALDKQKKMDRKLQLREIQLTDQQRSNNNKGRYGSFAANSDDFGESNILSAVYEKKEHRAYENRRKNEHLISLMKDQFKSSTYNARIQDQATLLEEKKKKDIYDSEAQKKAVDRKKKEYATKLYQDEQMAEKQKRKALEIDVKKRDYDKSIKLAEEFAAEQIKKKQDRFEKNAKHVQLVKDQMKDEKRTFAKTGIAVISS